jgi:hypothetical protein
MPNLALRWALRNGQLKAAVRSGSHSGTAPVISIGSWRKTHPGTRQSRVPDSLLTPGPRIKGVVIPHKAEPASVARALGPGI